MPTNSHGHGTHAAAAHRFFFWPMTRLGWWAVGLAAASVVLIPSWSLMGRLGGIPGLVCGFAGGVIALLAIFRQKERAISVFAAFVPFVVVVSFVLAELTGGHS